MAHTSDLPPTGPLARLRAFFYSEEAPWGMALVRITLSLVLLVDTLPRWPHVRECCSTDGTPSPLWASYGQPDLLPVPSGALAVALYTGMIGCLVCASAGWMTRVSLIGAMLLYAWFGMLDMLGALTKYTAIATHALFLLSLSQCGAVWSVDAWLKRRRSAMDPGVALPGEPQPPTSAAWPRRLLQLLIGLIYLASAVTKVNTPSFFSGDQLLFWMLTDVNCDNPIGDRLSVYPALLPLSAYATLLWEILFIVLCWRGLGRVCVLSIGVIFHFLTWGMLGLNIFPFVYLCLYFAFVEERDVARCASWLQRVARRFRQDGQPARTMGWLPQAPAWLGPAQSVTAFALFLAAVIVGGVEAEYRRDPFGERRAGGPLPLVPLPQEQVDRLYSTSRAVRPQDKLFALDLGSVSLGGVVADRRKAFRNGEQAIVQCSLLPPHEDMWVEFNLHDASGSIVKRHGQVAPREVFRSSHVLNFDGELAAGDYDFVLRFDGQEVARRRFSLLPDGSSGGGL